MKCDRKWWNDGRFERERDARQSAHELYDLTSAYPDLGTSVFLQKEIQAKFYPLHAPVGPHVPIWFSIARESMRLRAAQRAEAIARGDEIVYEDDETLVTRKKGTT